MASKYTIDADTGAYVIRGWRFDGSACIVQTEWEARAYIASHREKWAVYTIIDSIRKPGWFDVVVRQR